MIQLHEMVNRIANSDLPVLIEGETGTGKTLLARYIHNQNNGSNRLRDYHVV